MLNFKGKGIISVMENIVMRPFSIEDALCYYELYNNPKVAKYLPVDMIPQNLKASQEQIKSMFLGYRSVPYWAIAEEDTNELIGTCGFVSSDFFHKRIEIAYDLHPNVWGRGIMHNALKVCIVYGFEQMKIERIEAVTLPENIESIKTLKSLHFTHEGLLRKFKFFRKQMRDVESFSFTSEDYTKYYKNHG